MAELKERITTVELFDIDEGVTINTFILKENTTLEQRIHFENRLLEDGIRVTFTDNIRRVTLEYIIATYGD